MNEYSVPVNEAGGRLDQLMARYIGISRSRVQELIIHEEMRVAGRYVKANYRVKAGEIIQWQIPETNVQEPQAESISLDILYEDKDLLVINKPAGLVIHPGAGHAEGTLLNGLLYYDQKLAHVERAGLVHRLDKDTSGVLVVARTTSVQQALMKQFKDREVTKRYIALVQGLPPSKLFIENQLGRDPHHRKKQAVLSEGGRHAHSIVSLKESLVESAVVEVEIKTGRTHQIRVHLAHAGFPIIGDIVYGGKQRVPVKAMRHMLHAAHLSFTHPLNKKVLSCSARIPTDMQKVRDQLRVQHG